MRVSVIVPTFRRPDKLSRLLDVLDCQIADAADGTDVGVEILVVDNCAHRTAQSVAHGSSRCRYVVEPRKGVANARNRGVAEARGDYVIFIDDDELPQSGWFAAFLLQIERGVEACFGPVEPCFENPAPAALEGPLKAVFSRRIDAPTGTDISSLRAYLGSGNSLFLVSRCLSGPPPFEPRFNDGGEDVWLLRRLVEQGGVTLSWCNEAVVCELVGPERMTLGYLRRRKFRSGQLRCIVESGATWPIAVPRIAFWMAAGAIQFVVFGCAGMLGYRRDESLVFSAGGLGKLLWWKR